MEALNTPVWESWDEVITCRLSRMMRRDWTWRRTAPEKRSYVAASYSLIWISFNLKHTGLPLHTHSQTFQTIVEFPFRYKFYLNVDYFKSNALEKPMPPWFQTADGLLFSISGFCLQFSKMTSPPCWRRAAQLRLLFFNMHLTRHR